MPKLWLYVLGAVGAAGGLALIFGGKPSKAGPTQASGAAGSIVPPTDAMVAPEADPLPGVVAEEAVTVDDHGSNAGEVGAVGTAEAARLRILSEQQQALETQKAKLEAERADLQRAASTVVERQTALDAVLIGRELAGMTFKLNGADWIAEPLLLEALTALITAYPVAGDAGMAARVAYQGARKVGYFELGALRSAAPSVDAAIAAHIARQSAAIRKLHR